MDRQRERCLVSQEIRDALNEKVIISNASANLEDRVQPSSFEPVIGDEIFILDTEEEGLFRPSNKETIYRTLLKIPSRRRRMVSISSGFEIQAGYSYIAPLKEKLNLPAGFKIKASPKSSQGRLFNYVRLITDFNSNFDEVNENNNIKPSDMWLLIQPLAFNCIIKPGLSLNQLRIFYGDSRLKDSDIKSVYEKTPILYQNDDGKFVPIQNPVIQDGLRITIDASGSNTSGIVGLKARKNPIPIDLSLKQQYDVEDYFEPIKTEDNSVKIFPKTHMLLFSKEYIKIPENLNAELRDHSHVGIKGSLHFAGFFDNLFNGNAVLEVRSDEISPVPLGDGTPISELSLFNCNIPDKLYGEGINSHYLGQVGPKAPKYFIGADFRDLSRSYAKLANKVLVLPATELKEFRKNEGGLEFITREEEEKLKSLINEKSIWHLRYDCENDESLLQPIPYVVIFRDNEVFLYKRAKGKEHYGDERLFNKFSIGVGGHIKQEDAPDYAGNCIKREVHSEEIKFEKEVSEPVIIGTLLAQEKPVDRVHFGLVYAIETNGNVWPKESSLVKGEFRNISEISSILNDKDYEVETWTRILVPHVMDMRKMLKSYLK